MKPMIQAPGLGGGWPMSGRGVNGHQGLFTGVYTHVPMYELKRIAVKEKHGEATTTKYMSFMHISDHLLYLFSGRCIYLEIAG